MIIIIVEFINQLIDYPIDCASLAALTDYCHFNITWKDVFCLAFYFKWKYFVLIVYIYLKPFVFSASVFCSQIFTLKLKLWLNIGLTFTIS